MTRHDLSDQAGAAGEHSRGQRPRVTRPQGQAMSTQDMRPVTTAGTRAVGANTRSCATWAGDNMLLMLLATTISVERKHYFQLKLHF